MSTVAQPMAPLYDMGGIMPRVRPRASQVVRAPRFPLYDGGLGWLGDGAIVEQSAGATAGKIVAALPIPGAQIVAGVIIGVTALIGALMAGHEKRKKQATDENSAMNVGVSGFDSDLQQISAAVKGGQVDANGAMQAVGVAMSNYWALVAPHIQPGRNGCNGGSGCPPAVTGKNPCAGNIGAACCVGCYDLSPSITDAREGVMVAIQGQSQNAGGKYTAKIIGVNSSKYGGAARGDYTIDFTPGAGGGLTALTAGAGSLLPLLAIGALAFMVMR